MESVHPVPEKAVLADFRHAKTARAGTSGKKQNKKINLESSSKTKTVKEKMNIVT